MNEITFSVIQRQWEIIKDLLQLNREFNSDSKIYKKAVIFEDELNKIKKSSPDTNNGAGSTMANESLMSVIDEVTSSMNSTLSGILKGEYSDLAVCTALWAQRLKSIK